MHKFKSKTPVGNEIEWNLTFAVGDLKSVSDRLAFIRHGLKDPDDIKGAMGVLHLVEEHLDDLIPDIEDNIEKVIALDALATGQGLFVPRTRCEEEAIEALRRAQETDAARDARFDPSLSRAISKTIIRAEQVFRERFQNPMTEDDSISASVVEGLDIEAVGADQTPGEVAHA